MEQQRVENMRTLFLKKCQQRFGSRIDLESLSLNVALEDWSDDILVRIKLSMLGTQRRVTECHRYPSNCWEGIKERFFPYWLLRRFPVKYTEVDKTVEYNKFCTHIPNQRNEDYLTFFLVDHDWQPKSKDLADILVQTRKILCDVQVCSPEHLKKRCEELIEAIDQYIY